MKAISRHEKASQDADIPAEPNNIEMTGFEMPRVEMTEVAPILKDMDRLLEKNSLQAMKRFAAPKARLNGREFQPVLDQLEAALNNLDFNGAKTHLSTIAGMLDTTED